MNVNKSKKVMAKYTVDETEVRSNENDEIFSYESEHLFCGREISFYAVFVKSKLCVFYYHLSKDKNDDIDERLAVYEKIKETISEKYGECEETDEWIDESFKDRPEMFEEAVNSGHYRKKAFWKDGNLEIMISFYSEVSVCYEDILLAY